MRTPRRKSLFFVEAHDQRRHDRNDRSGGTGNGQTAQRREHERSHHRADDWPRRARLLKIDLEQRVAGATGSAAMALRGTLLQRGVPTRLRGRVSSLDFFVSIALLPIATALAAPAGAALGVDAVFAAAGIGPLLAALAVIGFARPDRDELRHPLDAPDGRRPRAIGCADGASPA